MDLSGFDHILFIIVLTGIYLLKDWKRILVLTTAFTIGHSLTLALSIRGSTLISTSLVELLIPITILATAILNYKKPEAKLEALEYIITLVFGLVHGLGFSNYLKSLLGKNSNVISELFAFNVGLEVGQLIIIAAVLVVSFSFIKVLKLRENTWRQVLTFAVGLAAIAMTLTRFEILINEIKT